MIDDLFEISEKKNTKMRAQNEQRFGTNSEKSIGLHGDFENT